MKDQSEVSDIVQIGNWGGHNKTYNIKKTFVVYIIQSSRTNWIDIPWQLNSLKDFCSELEINTKQKREQKCDVKMKRDWNQKAKKLNWKTK
jgi:hypothetical protein